MIVGFTGTRDGATDEQKKMIKRFLLRWKASKGVHGGCVGAVPGIYRAVPIAPYEEKFPIRDPLERNKDIIEASERMLACTTGRQEVLRSGTWSTIRGARKARKHIAIIYPDGSFDERLPDGSIISEWAT